MGALHSRSKCGEGGGVGGEGVGEGEDTGQGWIREISAGGLF